MAVINVQSWSVEQVVDWVTGLDASLSQYTDTFTRHEVTGQRLLNLMPGDIYYELDITRIGDQLLLHDAIQTLRDEIQTPWTTLQTLSLSLSVRCKNYRSELTQQKQRYDALLCDSEPVHHTPLTAKQQKQMMSTSSTESHSKSSTSSSSKTEVQSQTSRSFETIPTTSLSSASYLLDAGKTLIRWLTRFPFLGKLNYDEISRKLTKHCFELAVQSQRDTFADNAIEEVQYLCTKIIELCEGLIHIHDSLCIQPAGIDIITLRKRNEQDWGLQFESSYWGLHCITGVKLSSPAQQSGHLERGDEILQVNYQTVLAWPQASVISLLHENENEVILTVKRRPRHATTNLLLLGGHASVYLNKIPNRKSFFERRARENKQHETPVHEIVIEEEEEVVIVKDPVPAPEEKPTSPEPPRNNEASDVRFWKLYPKPKYLIRRRATVTGASPTDTRAPVTFISEMGSNTGAPGTQRPHAVVQHRRSTPVNANLLQPPVLQRPPLDKSRSAPEQESSSDTLDSNDDVFERPVTTGPVQPVVPKVTEITVQSTVPTQENIPVVPSEVPMLPPNPPEPKSRTLPDAQVKERTPPEPRVPPPIPKPRVMTRSSKVDESPTTLYRGILHIRSQLRKQSSSNSASALPVLGNDLSAISSSSPRWIRQNAIFYSNYELEILNPASKSSCVFRVRVAHEPVDPSSFVVCQANEVHSRPFAFKITSGDSITYYLAAESQLELDQWIAVMTTGSTLNAPLRSNSRSSSSSAGEQRKTFARAPYKRSISLGSSNSPPISSTSSSSATPPLPKSSQPPRLYGSSQNLTSTKQGYSPSRLLNRSKSSSLKTDWFLRSSTSPSSTSTSSSNISSITITSKKVNKTVQYPTPGGTPTKSVTQPSMGMSVKTKKHSTSSSSSCTSPTRKYVCPNCCNVTKVTVGTQTTESEEARAGDLKIVFFNNGESRV